MEKIMRKNEKNFLVLSLIFLCIFIIIFILLKLGTFYKIDTEINSYFFKSYNLNLGNPAKFFSNIFEPSRIIFFIVLFSCLLWWRNKKSESLLFVGSIALGETIMFLLKGIIQRARPLNSIIMGPGFSFPSGHATASIILFSFFIYFSGRIKSFYIKYLTILLCILGIILVSFSIIYLRVHWFSDILGGFALGLFSFFLVLFFISKYNFLRNYRK